MEYIKTYESLDNAIGSNALTPFVGMVESANTPVYASTSKFGEEIELISDGKGYFTVKKKNTKLSMFHCN